MKASREALKALERHMKQHQGQLLTVGSAASEEFDVLYEKWIRSRWDEGDLWVRSVWTDRP